MPVIIKIGNPQENNSKSRPLIHFSPFVNLISFIVFKTVEEVDPTSSNVELLIIDCIY